MKEHKGFTPGPWYYRPEEPSVEAEHGETGYFVTIAKCGESYTLDDASMKANARLIADAPRLYAENVELVEALQRAVQLVARAEVEGVYKNCVAPLVGSQWLKGAEALLARVQS